MAFVTIEDIQGNIELVVFPKSWRKYENLIAHDRIILVEGKVDAKNQEPKILVDSITTEIHHTVSIDSPMEPSPDNNRNSTKQDTKPGKAQPTAPVQDKGTQQSGKQIRETAREAQPIEDEWDDADTPPPPDAFPEDWESNLEPPIQTQMKNKDMEVTDLPSDETSTDPVTPPDESRDRIEDKATIQGSTPLQPEGLAGDTHQEKESAAPPIISNPGQKGIDVNKASPYILPPLPKYDGKDVRMITIILRNTGDKIRDKLRLRQIFGLLISYPGNDRFAFHIFEQKPGHLMEFPNMTTDINPELIEKIRARVGAENIRIETITFQ